MKEKKAVTGEYQPHYSKASKKEKKKLLDGFTKLTGCRRKPAIRLLAAKPVKQAALCAGGKAVKIKPGKKRPSNRKGKRIYTGEVTRALRQARAFFRYKRGKIPAPLMRRQMQYTAKRAAFGIAGEIAEKLIRISPAAIGRCLKKDKEALRLKGKSLTKPLDSPRPHLLHRRGAEKARFLADRHRPPLRAGRFRPVCAHAGRHRRRLRRAELFSLPNNARKRAFEALPHIKPASTLPVLEFHSGNGSEFINNAAGRWRKDVGAPFTGSRGHKKMTTVSPGKKTARPSVNMPVMTGLRGSLSWPPSASPWPPCSTSLCPRKS